MKLSHNSVTIYVQEDYDSMSRKAANMVMAQVNLKPDSVLGLATGSTPEGMYTELVKLYKQDSVDFAEVTTFNLDEYYGLPGDNEQSYAFYMNHHLFGHINVRTDSINIPDGMSEDVDAMCHAYDREIEASGNMDLQILGIGNNGHIGFNEPDVKFEAGTHLVVLDEATIEANARFFESREEVPKEAVSMGIRNIMHAKKVILLANGTGKSGILKDMLFGPVSPNVPASVLQLHNDVTLILDQGAATEILTKLGESGVKVS